MIGPKPPTICFYFNSEETRYMRKIHCVECGLPIMEITGTMRTIIDNEGWGFDRTQEMKDKGFVLGLEVWCKRCQTPYRIYY